MKFATVLMAALAIYTGASGAQTRKCTGPDGRITYSDVVCSTAGTSQTVNTHANTIDQSSARREIDAQRAANMPDSKISSTKVGAPQDCTFAYYALGDDKGKRLADAAKAECLANNQAKLKGEPNSLEAYGFWRDHRALKVAQRNGAIASAQARESAAQARDAATDAQTARNTKPMPTNPKLTCKPSPSGRTIECE